MNGEQFKSLVHIKYHVDTTYWAPEAAMYKFQIHEVYDQHNMYQQAMYVLCNNMMPFKNRINKVIKDDWLNLKTFEQIIHEMILVLEDLVQFNDPKLQRIEYLKMESWQLDLLDLLKSFLK
jgi:hypothetical protein